MTAYNNIIEFIKSYLNQNSLIKTSEDFCNGYMDLFFELSDELEISISKRTFEILDEINLLCDSYEKNEAIRKEDKYCINETELREKIYYYFQELGQP